MRLFMVGMGLIFTVILALISLTLANARYPTSDYLMAGTFINQPEQIYIFTPDARQRWLLNRTYHAPYYWLDAGNVVLYRERRNLMSRNVNGTQPEVLIRADLKDMTFDISPPYISPQGDRAAFVIKTQNGAKIALTDGKHTEQFTIGGFDLSGLFWHGDWLYYNTDTYGYSPGVYRVHVQTHEREFLARGILHTEQVNPFCGDTLILANPLANGWQGFDTRINRPVTLPIKAWRDTNSYALTCLQEQWIVGVNRTQGRLPDIVLTSADGKTTQIIAESNLLGWSGDETWVYSGDTSGIYRTKIAPNGIKERLYSFIQPVAIKDFWWSNDQQHLLILVHFLGENFQLIQLNADGSELRRLYTSAANFVPNIATNPEQTWVVVRDGFAQTAYHIDTHSQHRQKLPPDLVVLHVFQSYALPLHWELLGGLALFGAVSCAIGLKKKTARYSGQST